MKKIIFYVAIMTMSLFTISTKAQVNVNVNIGTQPLWGPVGYDHVDYYYLPDIDIYYYVPSGQYIYLDNGRWIWVNNLPAVYHNFDFYNAYKVVLNTPKPYLKHSQHLVQYKKYKNASNKQAVIRDSRDTKYSVVKGHPNYKENNQARPSRNDNKVSQNNGNERRQQTQKPSSNSNRNNDNKSNNNRSGGRG